MPFKSVTSIRTAFSVEGEVRAAAKLLDPSLVAMLSTDPVKLAIHPTGGGSGKVHGVSLSSADEVALLDRDTAVVRSGDEVWSLLDLAHKAHIHQVGRDARHLAMRPQGKTALVVHWDGRASELSVGRHEVLSREFALRGSVRACDVGAAETFVVVDGTEGGELRMHPGATPEPGATARAPLPREAKTFDRLRGGRDLSVLFKPGNKAVCVIRKTGSSLSAKMIELEVPPLEIAVAETSMFATFADGRIALYDNDALGNAIPAATMTMSAKLPARGEARTIAVTGKSVPVLWIGTTAGEVVQATALRKTPPM